MADGAWDGGCAHHDQSTEEVKRQLAACPNGTAPERRAILSRGCSATRESSPVKPQRIFLSSTCADLVDLRSALKESLEEMGYQVWASEFDDFPVDSNLRAQDNCLRNVERADQYVLILSDRYGAAYEGAAYPKHPLPEYPERSISVTWYEYLRALHCGKPMRILVREHIWDQRSVFRRRGGTARI